MNAKPEYRVIIAGSRDLHPTDVAIDYGMTHLLGIGPGLNTVVVSGHARGADMAGERWAKANDTSLVVMPADWDTHGKAAGFRRNKDMAHYASACFSGGSLLAFWDGKSRGTSHMIDLALEYGLEVWIATPGPSGWDWRHEPGAGV